MDDFFPAELRIRDPPKVYEVPDVASSSLNDNEVDVWLMLHTIRDPEFPNSISELRVLTPDGVHVDETVKMISIAFKPTIEHCSMATLIGLAIRIKLFNYFGPQWHYRIFVEPGSHLEEQDINKQLADKERVAAASDNPNLMRIISHMIRDPR